MRFRVACILSTAAFIAACTSTPSPSPTPPATTAPPPGNDILWVMTAAEYDASTLTVYRAATEDLQKFIDDKSFSALPDQRDAEHLPTAIITDVDETVVSNVGFQAELVPPYTPRKMYDWLLTNTSAPIPGAPEFFAAAQDAGVDVFFVTNRPCEVYDDVDGECPQFDVTLHDIRESGVAVDNEYLQLVNQQPHWKREKLVRRSEIAKTHRVIMLIGDNLGDFIECTREHPLPPCTAGATMASRDEATYDYRHYWGEGWYMLPNPMYGSWTGLR